MGESARKKDLSRSKKSVLIRLARPDFGVPNIHMMFSTCAAEIERQICHESLAALQSVWIAFSPLVFRDGNDPKGQDSLEFSPKLLARCCIEYHQRRAEKIKKMGDEGITSDC